MQISAQKFSHKELYDMDFTFTDGLYLTKDDFKNNCPIDKSQISTNLAVNDVTFFEQVFDEKTIKIFDNLGNEQEIAVSKIFGFCNEGTVYINHNGYFCRLGIIGSICHFQGYKTVYHSAPNPYMGYGYRPYYYGPSTYNHTTSEVQQYIYNFETGQVLEYNSQNMEQFLMADPKMHDEYADLSRKKKTAKLFYYMRLFNEKHPLYVPVYE